MDVSMIEVKLKDKRKPFVVVLYDSIKEMPSDRYNEYNKMVFLDFGVGSTIKDFNNHFSKLHAYLKNDKRDSTLQEMSNIYQNFFYAINKIGIWSYCFCTFIKKIDGEPYDKVELSDYRDTMKYLSDSGLSTNSCTVIIEDVKKNLIQSFDATFLADILNREVLTYYRNLKDKILPLEIQS